MISPPSRRFFPKEVAILFGLFIVNAMLMFVVGLSVGKSWQPTRRPGQATRPPTEAALGIAPNTPLWKPDRLKESPTSGSPVTGAPVLDENTVASLPKNEVISFPKGGFTVQVGSYLSEPEAQERIEELKRLGFPHAYFSAKELGDPKMVWYRVWLGFFSTADSARRGGEFLQKRGEVKTYLVRKNETTGMED